MHDDYYFYLGPSKYDGEEIVAIATGFGRKSENTKTGGMIQIYFLRSKISPQNAIKSQDDASVCGDCPHRQGTCYVLAFQGPRAVWEKYQRGGYVEATPEYVAERIEKQGASVRFGTYGDPAMVPYEVLAPLAQAAQKYTGYTHQWDTSFVDSRLNEICMASVDSREEYEQAINANWRAFFVTADTNLPKGAINCPASIEAGHRVVCEKCGLCDGKKSSVDRRKNIFIRPHGRGRKRITAQSTN